MCGVTSAAGLSADALLAAGAAVQAELARAELARLQRTQDEEQAHQRWLDAVLADLRRPGGPEFVRVAAGDNLHADWALERGLLNPLDTAMGRAVILPAAERWKNPGSLEAKVREARRTILTTCNANPGTWAGWDRMSLRDQWGTYLVAVQELEREGLIRAKRSSDNEAVAVAINRRGQ